jgi:hypothetical protein
MAGPADWGAVSVEEGPEKWGAQPVDGGEAGNVASFKDRFDAALPEPFINRVLKGEAIKRVFDKAVAGAKEGYGTPTPTGFSDETLQQLMDVGVFHDPAKGRPSPIQFTNEAFMLPLAKGWQALTGGISAGIHGAGSVAGAIAEELGESQGMSERLKREVINAGNWALIEGGFGTFSRPRVGPAGPQDQVIGTLPREADFKTGADVLGGEATEANLRRAWQEDGIHPAEAVHDAQNDAFAKHDITAKPKDYKLDAADEEVLTETGGKPGNLSAARHTLLDIGRDAQMLVAPMARGTTDSMAIAKDFANTMRRNRWEWSRIDADIEKRFTPEQRKRMWNAADEESVARQLGESREHQGLVTLSRRSAPPSRTCRPARRPHGCARVDLGMVEGEGLPAYTPRMVINAARRRTPATARTPAQRHRPQPAHQAPGR